MDRPVQDAGEGKLAAGLRRLLQSMQLTGRAILPTSEDELLQTIVEAAARLFGAAASSIALVDETGQTLQFRVAAGAGAENVVGMSIGVDQGIAGYVVSTGQPIAVSSVQQDPRFARETAESTGYVPRCILAMPLVTSDRPIGVIEVLDKIDAPSFGMQDMELLGIFARQAAIAIQASQSYRNLGIAFQRGIQRLIGDQADADVEEVQRILSDMGAEFLGPADILDLADQFAAISALGPSERQACQRILSAFGDYARSTQGYAE